MGTAHTHTSHFLRKISRAHNIRCSCGSGDKDIVRLILERPCHGAAEQRLQSELVSSYDRPLSFSKILLGPSPEPRLYERMELLHLGRSIRRKSHFRLLLVANGALLFCKLGIGVDIVCFVRCLLSVLCIFAYCLRCVSIILLLCDRLRTIPVRILG